VPLLALIFISYLTHHAISSHEKGELIMSTRQTANGVFTVRETARYLGLAESTLNKWRCIGGGPKYLKMGKAVRYRVSDINDWLDANERAHTSAF